MSAGEQGKFFEMDEFIFSRQREITNLLRAKAQSMGKPAGSERSEDVQREVFVDLAAELGLDAEKVRQDLVTHAHLARVRQEAAEAARLGVSGTPGSFVNGRFVSGAQPYAAFKAKVDQEIAWARDGNRPAFKKGTSIAQLRSQSRQRGVDPNKVHDIKAGEAPFEGTSGAKVTILHYLDYQ
jgi:hypothetical protein